MSAFYGYIRDASRAIDMYRRVITSIKRVEGIELLTRSRGHVRCRSLLHQSQVSLTILKRCIDYLKDQLGRDKAQFDGIKEQAMCKPPQASERVTEAWI
jgi:hypothetical protein